jgi:hypothetical protein
MPIPDLDPACLHIEPLLLTPRLPRLKIKAGANLSR